MTMIVGGTLGVTYPNSTNTPAASVNARFSPYITDTANVMKIVTKTTISGTNGITVNGTTYTTA